LSNKRIKPSILKIEDDGEWTRDQDLIRRIVVSLVDLRSFIFRGSRLRAIV